MLSNPVSRVLSFKTVIYLRRTSLHGSSRPSDYRPDKPILSTLLRMGFTWHNALPQCRWALTPPFHPYRYKSAVYFCCTFLRVASTGISPASCPAKLGLSSRANIRPRDRSDCSVSVILPHYFVRVKKRRNFSLTDENFNLAAEIFVEFTFKQFGYDFFTVEVPYFNKINIVIDFESTDFVMF